MRTHSFRTFYYSTVVSILSMFTAAPLVAQEFPGGFIEWNDDTAQRPILSEAQIQAFLPERGAFTFPSPYNTSGIRLTNASDCGGSDCVNYIGYSYWRNSNNHVDDDIMLILLGLDRSRGGAGPSLFAYNKVTDEVTPLGPLFEENDPLSWATGEGWYFSASRPYEIYLNSGAKLLRYDVVTHATTTVFDASALMGDGYYIWQVHSSNDDRVHSATLRDDSSYEMLGCMVYWEDSGQHQFFPREGDFDECQIDKSGNWLLIKEDVDQRDGEDNRIIDLRTGNERVLLDSAGAAGHSDMGYGYMVAADNWAGDANTQKLWDFTASTLVGVPVYHNTNWNISAPAHISHANSVADLAPGQQVACGSSVNRSSDGIANEIICFSLDGSNESSLVVAPVMTNLDASGGGDEYAMAPKGNLDVTGQYFIWTSNMDGSRLDAFLVKVPGQLRNVAQSDVPTPTPTPTPPSSDGPASAIVWSDLVNAIVTGSTWSRMEAATAVRMPGRLPSRKSVAATATSRLPSMKRQT